MNGEGVSPSLSSRSPAPARPVAARTRMLLEAPVLATLLRLAAPNVLNLLAVTGLITFDGLFIGRLGPDALTEEADEWLRTADDSRRVHTILRDQRTLAGVNSFANRTR